MKAWAQRNPPAGRRLRETYNYIAPQRGRHHMAASACLTDVCVCVTPKSFKSCSKCKVQRLNPTTRRPNHEF